MAPRQNMKRRKVDDALLRRASSSPAGNKEKVETTNYISKLGMQIQVAETSNTTLLIHQAKNYAVAPARQEGWPGNFRSFDSPYGNFLVPVVPTRADLGI